MKLNKHQRKLIFDKSYGVCWYCGEDLPEKGWHVDHIEPVGRYKDLKFVNGEIKGFQNMERPHLDVISNMAPSCSKCNLFKGGLPLEDFRQQITLQVERARAYSVNFRTAERFGLIKTIDKPVLFWFENRE